MLGKYPKKRPPLPKEYQKVYAKYYKKNRESETIASMFSQLMESWMHKKVAQDVGKVHDKITLEVGAGTLNQLKHERPRIYDIVEPSTELFKDNEDLREIRNICKDIAEINDSKSYDRIISIATFEHLSDLPNVVAKTSLLLNEGGYLRVAVPNEGNFLWTLGWQLTTGLEFKRKHNLDYGIFNEA